MPPKDVYSRPTRTSVSSGPSIAFDGSQRERRAFDLFRTRVAFQLSGEIDGWLWNVLLLQATHQEPAIRHAVLALGSLCEQFDPPAETPDSTVKYVGKQGPLALQQYNLAIAELTSAATSCHLALDVCLMVCMLFAYFEVIRGHHGSAMLHICSGVKILSEHQSSPSMGKSFPAFKVSQNPYIDMQSLEVIFNRLHSQAAQMAGLPYMRLSNTKATTNAAGFSAEIPLAFKTMEEARHSLEYHTTQCVRGLIPPAMKPPVEQIAFQRLYLNVFAAWHASLQAFLKGAGDSLSVPGKLHGRLLLLNKMHLAFNMEAFTTGDTLDNMRWDNYLEIFKEMITLARDIVEHNELDLRKDPRTRHKFSIGMSCIAPLYGVATCCRDPAIRREAVALMRRSHNQQGLLNAMMASNVCQRLIEIEEQNLEEVRCCADVPPWARVSGIRVKIDSEGRVGAVGYRLKPGGSRSVARKFDDLFVNLSEKIDTGGEFQETAHKLLNRGDEDEISLKDLQTLSRQTQSFEFRQIEDLR